MSVRFFNGIVMNSGYFENTNTLIEINNIANLLINHISIRYYLFFQDLESI